MRLVGAILALALAAGLSGPASGQTSAQRLAPGEIVVELGAIGTAEVPADLATYVIEVIGQGPSPEAAQADLDATARRIGAAARQAGGAAVTVSRLDPSQASALRMFDVREEPPPPLPDGTIVPPPAPSPPSHMVMGTLTIRLTDTTRVAAVSAAIDAAQGVERGNASPTYALTSDRAARAEARAQALAETRADADAYAASLNMRIVRMERVSERTGVELLPLLLGAEPQLARRAFGRSGRDREILVAVGLGVDFVLAPR